MIQAKATMRRIGLGLIDEKRRAIVEEQQALLTEEKGMSKEKIQAPTDRYQVRSMKGRDLLSLLSTFHLYYFHLSVIICLILILSNSPLKFII